MGPGPNQTAALVGQIGEFYLQRAFSRVSPPAENFQDQAGAVEHLGVPGLFQVALLHRRERAVHDDDPCLMGHNQASEFFDLTLADKGGWPDALDRDQPLIHDVNINRAGEHDGLVETSLG